LLTVNLGRRLSRLVIIVRLIFQGWFVVCFLFPKLNLRERQQAVRRWSQSVLDCLNIQVQVSGTTPLVPTGLVVANHSTWLDMVAINAVHPCIFVAKQEVSRWPVIGRLVTGVGTIFIHRHKSSAVSKTVCQMRERLSSNQAIVFFPEGTTTDGQQLGRFAPALFQAAIDLSVPVTPIAIGYKDEMTKATTRYAFVGDTSFVKSLWTLAGFESGTVHLMQQKGIAVTFHDRKTLCAECESTLGDVLSAFWNLKPQQVIRWSFNSHDDFTHSQ
jgi:1-acyl-sn-glycerol-3-phosphate acyltransferase